MTQEYILGLLSMKPMSGYDIQVALEAVKVKQWGDILVGSIYYALKKLEKENMVHCSAIEKTGHRQRAIYEITEKGREYLHTLILQNLSDKPSLYPVDVYVGLNFSSLCTKEEIKKALQRQYAHLEEEQKTIEQDYQAKLHACSGALPLFMELTFENMRDHVKLQMNYLKRLIHNV